MKARTYPRDVFDFLDVMLGDQPASKKTIARRAAVHGFSEDQLDRAKRKLGIVAFKQRGTMTGGWYWALPQHVPKDPTR
jgi:hypothetical protein